ncbi:SOSS complex subunit B homolog [Selaginella moellendorffii]|nr:SOSS complex subunit B homolog [Selaginella moellendorffii]|eukprot:XP_002991107.2 SOSS complex subunit B homolog [Selaginella moellendorffii]
MATMLKVRDLRPSVGNNINTTFIILEKYNASRSDGGILMCIALVADSTASVHLQMWGAECDAFQPSDIVRLTNGIFSFHKANLVLRAGKKGLLEKIGEFSMVFVEIPNMSTMQWVQDPANPKGWIPLTHSSPAPTGPMLAGAASSNPGRH